MKQEGSWLCGVSMNIHREADMTSYYYHTQAILNVANQNYNNGEGRIDEAIIDSVRGDTLASFVRKEIHSVTFQVEDKVTAMMDAQDAILKAMEELMSVSKALRREIDRIEG